MKIKGTCTRCGREFLVDQLEGSGGHCPWDGQPFNADYTASLVDSLREAEAAGSALEAALEQLGGLELTMELDEESILKSLRDALREQRRNRVKV